MRIRITYNDPGGILSLLYAINRPLEKRKCRIIKTVRFLSRTNAVRRIRYDKRVRVRGVYVRRIVHSKIQTRPTCRLFRSFVVRPSCVGMPAEPNRRDDVVVRHPQIISITQSVVIRINTNHTSWARCFSSLEFSFFPFELDPRTRCIGSATRGLVKYRSKIIGYDIWVLCYNRKYIRRIPCD